MFLRYSQFEGILFLKKNIFNPCYRALAIQVFKKKMLVGKILTIQNNIFAFFSNGFLSYLKIWGSYYILNVFTVLCYLDIFIFYGCLFKNIQNLIIPIKHQLRPSFYKLQIWSFMATITTFCLFFYFLYINFQTINKSRFDYIHRVGIRVGKKSQKVLKPQNTPFTIVKCPKNKNMLYKLYFNNDPLNPLNT